MWARVWATDVVRRSIERGGEMGRKNASDYLIDRGGWWVYRRRVPRRAAHLDTRNIVRITTNQRTDGSAMPSSAAVIAAERIHAEVETHWAALATLDEHTAEDYAAAVSRARALGFGYQSVDRLIAEPLAEIAARVARLERDGLVDNRSAVTAVLGGAAMPDIHLSTLVDLYLEAVADRLLPKSANQRRKYINPRKKAVANAVALLGDVSIGGISRADAIRFRTWWIDRITDEGVQIETANKDIGHLITMIDTVYAHHQLDSTNPFQGLRLRNGPRFRRTAFDAAWVQDRLLRPGALDSLNHQARMAVYVCADTGMRPSEVVNLLPERIQLAAAVPHVQVRPDDREIKTTVSLRDVPLTGLALWAMRQVPDGFPRYRDKEDSFGATVNKAFRENKLSPSPAHTLYSLRHTYRDKLDAAEVPERLAKDIFGHAMSGTVYGNGPSLAHKAKWMRRIGYRRVA